MDNNKWIRQFKKSKNIKKQSFFVSIHIFKAMLQVKKSFKKDLCYITIKVKKVLEPIILLSYAVSKQC